VQGPLTRPMITYSLAPDGTPPRRIKELKMLKPSCPAVPRRGPEAGDSRTNRFSWIRGKPDSFMHVSSEPNSTQIIKPKVMNRHFKEVNYGLALNAWNTVHPHCRCICDSWIYRQDSMDNWKVDYYYLYYPRVNFADPRKTPAITFPA